MAFFDYFSLDSYWDTITTRVSHLLSVLNEKDQSEGWTHYFRQQQAVERREVKESIEIIREREREKLSTCQQSPKRGIGASVAACRCLRQQLCRATIRDVSLGRSQTKYGSGVGRCAAAEGLLATSIPDSRSVTLHQFNM